MPLTTLLVSTYEMGRQPFGLASPATWLRERGADARCLDLSIEPFDPDAVRAADLVAFYVPMHTAARMAAQAIERARGVNPDAHYCVYGLYAPENADYFRRLGVGTVLGGEFETGLVRLAERLAEGDEGEAEDGAQPEPLVSRELQQFRVPDRGGLPELNRYAQLVTAGGEHRTVGYTEASRGCKHTCRHCPVVPVYEGRFRVVQRDVVLEDIRRQVAAGARHITFGDPDFFNGIGHAVPIIRELHEEHPELSYDVTIKVEHLLKHSEHLETLAETGCLFVTSAVESFDEEILEIFEKHHSPEDLEAALARCREAGLLMVPTFVAFTPWTTLAGYRRFLAEIARLGLVEHVAPIQYAIRLLVPPGSKLLELAEVEALVGALDQEKFVHPWTHADSRVDALQRDTEALVEQATGRELPRREIFRAIWERAHRDAEARVEALPALPSRSTIPYLTEPWYC